MSKYLLVKAVEHGTDEEFQALLHEKYPSDRALSRALQCGKIDRAQALFDNGYQLRDCPCPVFNLPAMQWAYKNGFTFGSQSLDDIIWLWNGTDQLERIVFLIETASYPVPSVKELAKMCYAIRDDIAAYLVKYMGDSELNAFMDIFAKQGKLEAVRILVDRGILFARQNFEMALSVADIKNITSFCNLAGVPLECSFKSVMTNIDDDDLALELLAMYREQLRDQKVFELATTCNLYDKESYFTDFSLELGKLYEKFGKTVSYAGLFSVDLDRISENHEGTKCYIRWMRDSLETFRNKKVPDVDKFFEKYPGVLETISSKIDDNTLTDMEIEEFCDKLEDVFN